MVSPNYYPLQNPIISAGLRHKDETRRHIFRQAHLTNTGRFGEWFTIVYKWRFCKAVELVANCNGRLVVSGSAKRHYRTKIVPLNSTGTAVLLHAADAIHGDLGMIQGRRCCYADQQKWRQPEIKVLVPLLKNFGNQLIGMVGNTQSYLAGHCDIMINSSVEQEACPNNLAPTSSSTTQMVMGDALAVCPWNGKASERWLCRFHRAARLEKIFTRGFRTWLERTWGHG